MATIDSIPAQRLTDESNEKVPRKRRRLVISCVECHRRKQKCDRELPCSNCCSRNKEASCRYETLGPSAKVQRKASNANDDDPIGHEEPSETTPIEDKKVEDDSAAQLAALGYSKPTGHSTLGVFKKIESYGNDAGPMISHSLPMVQQNGLTGKYKNLIRQLPAKPLQQELIKTFFAEVNPLYYSVDEGLFMEQLDVWNALPFTQLNKGPQTLSVDQRYFPALLFEVLGLALLYQDTEDPAFESLKYAAEMSFDDVATEYSDTGVAILNLLGKRDMSLLAVQAGFLRTSFLKNSGLIAESWHSLGQTIRDAQELGLDKDFSPLECSGDPGKALESLWMLELRRRIWIILHNWDEHMGLVLGRAKSGVFDTAKIKLPLDTKFPKDRTKTVPIPRSEMEPPTLMTKTLAVYSLLSMLPKILALEKEGPHPRNSSKIEALHEEITRANNSVPGYLRLENPDTTWDNHPDCGWLFLARPYVETNCAFLILSLHKPYIFTMQRSRLEALGAALRVLRYQKVMLSFFTERHFKMHNPVLSTFDAIIVIAAIYILHPEENRDRLDEALEYFEWCVEALKQISTRNSLAKSALGVLAAVRIRLMKSLGAYKPGSISSGMSNSNATFTPPSSHSSSSTPPALQRKSQSEIPHIDNTAIHDLSSTTSSAAQSLPTPDFNFDTILPLQPTHDLLYNDLSSFYDPSTLDDNPPYIDPNLAWQFDGSFQGDSFWDFLNQNAP